METVKISFSRSSGTQ